MDDAIPVDALAAELIRRTPSAWAEEVRWIKRRETSELAPYSFAGRRYLVDPHDDEANVVVVKKGAQTGFSEWAINRCLHTITALNDNALTVLPQREQLRQFVQSRVDAALDQSPVLRQFPRHTSNPEHKRIGEGNWYFRGSNSPATIVEFPVRLVDLDEYDLLNPEASDLALQRLDGISAELRRVLKLSTPTFGGRGIDSAYADSSRGRYNVPCPHCLELQDLRWGENGNLGPAKTPEEIATSSWRCRICCVPWSEEEKRQACELGVWVHDNPNHHVHGYHLSQLYSPAETSVSLVAAFWDAEHSDDRQRKLRHWNNAKLGLAWAVEGEQLTKEQIHRVAASTKPKPFSQTHGARPGYLVSAGIDPGSRIHVVISEWNAGAHDAKLRVRRDIAFLTVDEFEELDGIMDRYGVSCAVLDWQPETRKAREFQSRFPERVWLASYPDGMGGEMVRWWGFEDMKTAGPVGMAGGKVQIHRTEAFDRYYGRYATPPTIELPEDIPDEAVRHLTTLVVKWGSDKYGNPTRRYDNGGDPDHFAHASLYSEIAGLQVGELGAAEVPEDRGASHDLEMFDWSQESEEMDFLGAKITGVY